MAKRIVELPKIQGVPPATMATAIDRYEQGGTGTYQTTLRDVVGSVIGRGTAACAGGESLTISSTELLMRHTINVPAANSVEGGQINLWYDDCKRTALDAYKDVGGHYRDCAGNKLGTNERYTRVLVQDDSGHEYPGLVISASTGNVYKPASPAQPNILCELGTGGGDAEGGTTGECITDEHVNYTPAFEILGIDTATSPRHMLLTGRTYESDNVNGVTLTRPIASWQDLHGNNYNDVLASGTLDGIEDRMIKLPYLKWLNDESTRDKYKVFSQGRITLPDWVPDDAIGVKIRFQANCNSYGNNSFSFGVGPMSRHGQLGPYQNRNLDSDDGKISYSVGQDHYKTWGQSSIDPIGSGTGAIEGDDEGTFDLRLDPGDRVLYWAFHHGNSSARTNRPSYTMSMYIEGVYTRETYQTCTNMVAGSKFTTYTPVFRLPGRENKLEAENTLCFGDSGWPSNLNSPYASGTLVPDTFSTFTQFSGITDRYIQLPDLSFLVSGQASTHSSFVQGEISLPDWLPRNTTGLRVRVFFNGNPRSNAGIAFGLFPLGQRSHLLGPYASTNINHATGKIGNDFLKKIGDYYKTNNLMGGVYPFYGWAQIHLDPVGQVWKDGWNNSQYETEMYDTFDVAVDNTGKLSWTFYFGPHSSAVDDKPLVMVKVVIEGVYTEERSYAIQGETQTGNALVHVDDTPPDRAQRGLLWWNTLNATMYVHDGLAWVVVDPK